MNKRNVKLKSKLNYHYRAFNKGSISPDPVEFPHKFNGKKNIEISAFISSVFAYGTVRQILNTLEKVHQIMGDEPHRFVLNYDFEKDAEKFDGIVHRFFSPNDIAVLFHILNRVYREYRSLRYLFLLYHFEGEPNIKLALSRFSKNLLNIGMEKSELTPGLKFMFPDPKRGSACKRMNLFLRWMVRKDKVDFGLWKEISPAQLVIPVDTHIAKICKDLKLAKSKTANWKMAEEITENLKKFSRTDPVKYDFAICHIGMRKMKFYD